MVSQLQQGVFRRLPGGGRGQLPGRARPGARPARTERGRQDHHAAGADGPDPADRRQIRVFGEQVVPGAPVLSRLGAFVEGPGFLPHLTGRENLRLFWAASGRPPEQAELDTVLEIAGLGPSLERRVKTYSHGMQQRLAIAQAMLGPARGADPGRADQRPGPAADRRDADGAWPLRRNRPDRDRVLAPAGRGGADLHPRGGDAPGPAGGGRLGGRGGRGRPAASWRSTSRSGRSRCWPRPASRPVRCRPGGRWRTSSWT